MKKSITLLVAAAAFLAGAAGWVVSQGNGTQTGAALGGVDTQAGKALYAENCAACHGENLEGQPDWRSPGADGRLPAPPHDETGHSWHHPDRILFDYTKLGGKAALASQGVEFDSGMPGFGDTLSDEEIWNILGFIKSTWPDRVRQLQAERTGFDNDRAKN